MISLKLFAKLRDVDCMLTVCWLYVDCMLTVCWLYVGMAGAQIWVATWFDLSVSVRIIWFGFAGSGSSLVGVGPVLVSSKTSTAASRFSQSYLEAGHPWIWIQQWGMEQTDTVVFVPQGSCVFCFQSWRMHPANGFAWPKLSAAFPKRRGQNYARGVARVRPRSRP